QLIALACPVAVRVFDHDLQHVGIAIAVDAMTAGAGRLTTLEAAALHQRLRPIEAARPTVGPEIALWIVGGNRLTDEEREGVVLVTVAGFEPKEHVVLVPVTVAAGIERLTRRGIGR